MEKIFKNGAHFLNNGSDAGLLLSTIYPMLEEAN